MKEIFVVIGSTGEYSDRSEWCVAAVETEDAAKRYVAALDVQYQSIPQHMRDDRWDHEDEIKAIMTLDPEFSMDYTGTRYHYHAVNYYGSAEVPLPEPATAT